MGTTTVQKAINDVIIDLQINTLSALDEALVAEYQHEMETTYGETEWQQQWIGLPKITKDDYLWSGFHTVEAAFRAFGGEHVIEFTVEGENRNEALLLATGENAKRGRKPTQTEKRVAVHRWLTHPEGKLWTNAHIANKCNVGDDLVKTVFNELSLVSESDIYDPNYERPVVLKYINKHGQEAVIDTTNLGKRLAEPEAEQTEFNLDPTPAPDTAKAEAITEYSSHHDSLMDMLQDYLSENLECSQLTYPAPVKIDMDYIRRRIYFETGYYGWGQLMLENIEADVIEKQTAIAKSIVEGDNSKAFEILDEIKIFDELISLYAEIDALGAPFTAPVERVLREIHAKFTDETFDSLSRGTRILQLQTLEINFKMHLESEKDAREAAEAQRIAEAQRAEAEKAQIEIQRKLEIVNGEADLLREAYYASEIVRSLEEVLEVAAEAFDVDLKTLNAITIDVVCADPDNPGNFTSEGLSNWRLKLISIRQGIEQRSEWAKSMMRDVQGCRESLKWTLINESELSKDVIDIQDLSAQHNLTPDAVLKLKDAVFNEALTNTKAQHKAIRKEIYEAWHNDAELKAQSQWADFCVNVCRAYLELSAECFNGVRTKPEYTDYRTLVFEISLLERVKDDILSRADWVAALIPDTDADVKSYRIANISISLVDADAPIDDFKDRVTVYLDGEYIGTPKNLKASELPDALAEQLMALTTDAIDA